MTSCVTHFLFKTYDFKDLLMKISSVPFIISVMVVISSCEKAERLERELDGTWELRHLTGFVPQERLGDRPLGNGDIYKFQGNNFERHFDGKITDNGTFSVQKESSNHNEKLEFILVLDGVKYDHTVPFELSGGKLVLHFGALISDGAIGTYAKL